LKLIVQTIILSLMLVYSERKLTFTFAMLSSVRLSVVCHVRAPYSGD